MTFVPFSAQEAQIYWSAFKSQPNTDTEALNITDLEELTGYNPSLLAVCRPKRDLESAQERVWMVVKGTASDVIASLTYQNAIWYVNNISKCIDFLYCASCREAVPIDRLAEYYTSWLNLEYITYVAERNDEEFFPRVNFPLMVKLLMEHFRTVEISDEKYNPIMVGYRFQYRFFLLLLVVVLHSF